MPNTRPRRIVRRAVMALAVVVLLVAWYVGSVMALSFGLGAHWVRPSLAMKVFLQPWIWYCRNENMPFRQQLIDYSNEIAWQGTCYRERAAPRP